MSEYEITYHIDPQLDESAREELSSAIEHEVTTHEGKVTHRSQSGRKKLAYEIDKKQSVFTQIMNVDTESSNVADLHKFLQRQSGVLRFMILQTPHREDTGVRLMEQLKQQIDKDKPASKTSSKKVTMQDVEKGIEEALHEEVK